MSWVCQLPKAPRTYEITNSNRFGAVVKESVFEGLVYETLIDGRLS